MLLLQPCCFLKGVNLWVALRSKQQDSLSLFCNHKARTIRTNPAPSLVNQLRSQRLSQQRLRELKVASASCWDRRYTDNNWWSSWGVEEHTCFGHLRRRALILRVVSMADTQLFKIQFTSMHLYLSVSVTIKSVSWGFRGRCGGRILLLKAG